MDTIISKRKQKYQQTKWSNTDCAREQKKFKVKLSQTKSTVRIMT